MIKLLDKLTKSRTSLAVPLYMLASPYRLLNAIGNINKFIVEYEVTSFSVALHE